MSSLAILSTARVTVLGSFPKFDPDQVATLWSDTIVDNAGYKSRTDKVLALHNEPGIDRYFPTADELRKMGVQVEKLAVCIDEGLIIVETIGNHISTMTPDELNGCLDNILEASEAYAAHPTDAIDRAMHRHGCCGCDCH